MIYKQLTGLMTHQGPLFERPFSLIGAEVENIKALYVVIEQLN